VIDVALPYLPSFERICSTNDVVGSPHLPAHAVLPYLQSQVNATGSTSIEVEYKFT
jgi:hypothetical protein